MANSKLETRNSKQRKPAGAINCPRRGFRGFTLVEMLLALAITAVLALAVSAALSASLSAYSTSAQAASMQTTGRLVMQRVLNMIRVASLHDAFDPNDAGVTLLDPADANHPLHSVGIAMRMPDGSTVRIWWQVNAAYGNADLGDMMYQKVGDAAATLVEQARCLRDANNAAYVFTLASRTSDTGLMLSRATLDLVIEPEGVAGTSIESARGANGELHLIGSTMPRRNLG
ncbi:MAG: prepilin-type N-terminal cleavage/methylation domain-containing protein [Phycisphaeraceae bacterium]